MHLLLFSFSTSATQIPQMGHHAISKDGQKRQQSRDCAKLYEAAKAAWEKACHDAMLNKAPIPTLSKIVAQFPGVNRTTLWQQTQCGKDSKCISAAKHAYLNPTESQTLVDFVKEIADRCKWDNWGRAAPKSQLRM